MVADKDFMQQVEKWRDRWGIRENDEEDRKNYLDTPLSDTGEEKYRKIALDFKEEFLQAGLWIFLWNYRHYLSLGNYESTRDSYHLLSDLVNIEISPIIQTEDAEMRSRRITAYTELWRRFKLVASDIQDSPLPETKPYIGRSPINTYSSCHTLLERLQSWYYDYAGGILMPERTLDTYKSLCAELSQLLAKRNETMGEDRTSDEEKKKKDHLPPDQHDKIKKKVRDLQNYMLNDIGRIDV
jgi:hypothetical protein